VDEWIKKMKYVCNRILFSLKKEILPFATTQMDLEDILLSEIAKICKISLICGILFFLKVKYTEIENKTMATWGGVGNGKVKVEGYKVADM
jgi:hypothetical protein